MAKTKKRKGRLQRKRAPFAGTLSDFASLGVGVLATGLVPYAAWNLYVSPVFRLMPMGYWRALGLGVVLRATTAMTDGTMMGDMVASKGKGPFERFALNFILYTIVTGVIAAFIWGLGTVIPKRPEGGNTYGPHLPIVTKHPALGTYTIQ